MQNAVELAKRNSLSPSLRIDIECKGNIGRLRKEVALAFREYFKPTLPAYLGEQAVLVARKRHDEIGRQLIGSRQQVEVFRFEFGDSVTLGPQQIFFF